MPDTTAVYGGAFFGGKRMVKIWGSVEALIRMPSTGLPRGIENAEEKEIIEEQLRHRRGSWDIARVPDLIEPPEYEQPYIIRWPRGARAQIERTSAHPTPVERSDSWDF